LASQVNNRHFFFEVLAMKTQVLNAKTCLDINLQARMHLGVNLVVIDDPEKPRSLIRREMR
jgi:hypothetical protein